MIKLGEQTIGGIYLGETRIARIYLGETPVYYEGVVPSVLPEGYTRLQYIENPLTKGAYFDTGVNVSTANIGFQIDFMSYDEIGETDYGAVIGGGYDVASKALRLTSYCGSSSGWSGSLRFGGSASDTDAHLPAKNTRFSAALKTSTYEIGNNSYPISRGDLSGNYSLHVFGFNRRNAGHQQQSHGRLYSLKILSGNTVLKNYIPCINASEQVGVYDTINSEFKQSAVSNKFVAGPVWGE